MVAWAGIHAAGVHPTIAGVIIGLVTPVRTWLRPEGVLADGRSELEQPTEARGPRGWNQGHARGARET
nr:Na+/H+ antiporter NhaA [Myxococcus xanthus]